jgi:flagellar biosynthesis/type III secretory pathway M-ring protein FliF/YscJ
MPDPSSFDTFSLATTLVKVAFVVVGLLFVFAVVRAIIYAPRRRKILRDAGLDPMTASVQMEARLANSALLAPAGPAAKTVEERLAELESLHGRGLISSEELHEARAKILAG